MNLPVQKVEAVLGRTINPHYLDYQWFDFKEPKKILVTGANGSIGSALVPVLKSFKNAQILSTDIEGDHEYLDVTDFQSVLGWVNKFQPDYIINIAGAKHAPDGEHETFKTLSINTIGTKNLIDAMPTHCVLILTSTCKATNPEVVYGASKLIAERMTLNAGGRVARFYNVVESSKNVFEIWNDVPKDEPLKVVESCNRHFISIREAVGLMLYLMVEDQNKNARFIVHPGTIRNMKEVGEDLYPNRMKVCIPPRRGDRLSERMQSTAEELYATDFANIYRVRNIHDK
jgi:FlaA1/EpsC-like NDP-sugar epimerase